MVWFRLVVLAVALVGTSSAAMADEDRKFHYECPQGAYLTGLVGRAGAGINTIDIECADWNAERQSLGMPQVWDYNDVGDPTGGDEAGAHCDKGWVVAGDYRHDYAHSFEGESEVLHNIAFNCKRAVGEVAFQPRRFGSTWPLNHLSERAGHRPTCGEGNFATGIQGRAGKFVYDLQLICRPAPSGVSLKSDAATTYKNYPAVGASKRAGGSLRKGDDFIVGATTTPPPPAGSTPPPPAVRMTKTTGDVDVLEEPDGAKYGGTGDFLPGQTLVPVLVEKPGWCQLDLKAFPFVVGGKGWVSATFLESCGK